MKPLLPKKNNNNSLLAKRPKLVLTCLDYFSVGFFALAALYLILSIYGFLKPIRTTVDENGRIVTSNLISTEYYLQNEFFKGKLDELRAAHADQMHSYSIILPIFGILSFCTLLSSVYNSTVNILRAIICNHFNSFECNRACKFYSEGNENPNFKFIKPKFLIILIMLTIAYCVLIAVLTSPLIDELFKAQKYYLTDSMRSSLLYFKSYSTASAIEDMLYVLKACLIVGQISAVIGLNLRSAYNSLVSIELSDDF